MDILYLVKQDPDETLRKILDVQMKEHRITVVDLRTQRDYGAIIDLIAANDRIVAW